MTLYDNFHVMLTVTIILLTCGAFDRVFFLSFEMSAAEQTDINEYWHCCGKKQFLVGKFFPCIISIKNFSSSLTNELNTNYQYTIFKNQIYKILTDDPF